MSPANSSEGKGTTLKKKSNGENLWTVDAKQHRLDKAKQMNAQKTQVCLSRDSSPAILDEMHTEDLVHAHVCTALALPLEMLYTIT